MCDHSKGCGWKTLYNTWSGEKEPPKKCFWPQNTKKCVALSPVIVLLVALSPVIVLLVSLSRCRLSLCCLSRCRVVACHCVACRVVACHCVACRLVTLSPVIVLLVALSRCRLSLCCLSRRYNVVTCPALDILTSKPEYANWECSESVFVVVIVAMFHVCDN